MKRWISFFVVLAIGAAAGMYYGWKINPVRYVDTTPDSLRMDYKTDYVLMVAEAYQADQDLGLALRRLAVFGEASPLQVVSEVLTYARQAGWAEHDVALMQSLAQALQTINPVLGAPTP
jgi:hypothetical protein